MQRCVGTPVIKGLNNSNHSNLSKFNLPLFCYQQQKNLHTKPTNGAKIRQKALVNMSVEAVKDKAERITTLAKKKRFLKDRYEAQVRELRKQYNTEYNEKKKQSDEKSRATFFAWREKVLSYREQKRRISLLNVKQHENYMHYLKSEFDRVRREKNQERLNREAIMSSYRIDSLRRLANESPYFINESNIDAHITNQLDPVRVVVPTIFHNRSGINDEVGYEVWSTILKEHEFQVRQRQRVTNILKLQREIQEDDEFVKDPLYPHVKLHYDPTSLIPSNDALLDEVERYEKVLSPDDLKGNDKDLEDFVRKMGLDLNNLTDADIAKVDQAMANEMASAK